MRILTTRHFSKWTKKNGIGMHDLFEAGHEVIEGIFEANLGAQLIKKRVGIGNIGKRSGARTILFFKQDDKLIYIHGFKKNEKGNITDAELKAFKVLANIFERMTNNQVNESIKSGYFIEVKK